VENTEGHNENPRHSPCQDPGLPNARQSATGTSAAVGHEVGNHPRSGYDTTLLRKRAIATGRYAFKDSGNHVTGKPTKQGSD